MILIPIPIRIRPPTGAMEHGILRPMNMPVPNPAMVRADEMAGNEDGRNSDGVPTAAYLHKSHGNPYGHASMLVATASVRMTL